MACEPYFVVGFGQRSSGRIGPNPPATLAPVATTNNRLSLAVDQLPGSGQPQSCERPQLLAGVPEDLGGDLGPEIAWGIQSNMNVNEVISNRAIQLFG